MFTLSRCEYRGGRRALVWIALAALAFGCTPNAEMAGVEEGALLYGRITSETGGALAGIPVRARGEGKSFSVVVYSDSEGTYSFPSWSDLTPGTHTLSIELPDFEHVHRDAVALSDTSTAQADFALVAREPSIEDAIASEIVAALPGTDREKVLFAQCSTCHSIQRALRFEYTKEEWVEIIYLMGGRRRTSQNYPNSFNFSQQRYVEPLAEYLASIRGPGSSDEIPFELRPRPTSEEATRLVITEYDLPRGGERELFMLRGDPRHVWPHDVVVDDQYAWYTDHFSNALGRLDKNTGEAIEIPYPIPPGGGRVLDAAPGEIRAGNPGGGSHDLLADSQGNLIIGMDEATVRYNPNTNVFDSWPSGASMFGLDSNDHIWHTNAGGPLFEVNLNNGEVTAHTIPYNHGVYDMETDAQGRTIINIWRGGQLGVFDPATEEYKTYDIETPEPGPRRGEMDAEGNFWTPLFYAGRILRFNPDSGEMKEYPMFPGTEAYDPPYAAPYTLSVDNENGWVWTTDFNANRLHRIDMETGESVEYFMPRPYVMRDLTVEAGTERPTLWIPSYRPPSQIVKVQVR